MSLKQTYEDRRGVLWFGPPPQESVLQEFVGRNLLIHLCDTDVPIEAFRRARGAVLQYDNAKPGALRNRLRALLRPAFDHGLVLVVRADSESSVPRIEKILGDERVKERVWPRVPRPECLVAEDIARHTAGPCTNPGLEIESRTQLDDDARLLLARSFADCKRIIVDALPGGRSAQTFSVHAVLGEQGGVPLPFFVKIDRCAKIENEMRNYEDHAAGYVPFNHRPNLAEGRSLLGLRKGILVGSFVERSETLRDVVRRGTGERAIYSLFEHALRGWRLQAYESPEYTRFAEEPVRSVTHSLKPRARRPVFPPDWIPDEVQQISGKMGARDPRCLLKLLEGLPPLPHRCGPIHGDLHARNVQVHGSDAILIDFNAVQDGPLVADPASMEVSIVFDGFLEGSEAAPASEERRRAWSRLVDRLYDGQHLDLPPPPVPASSPGAWMWSCVRQIRFYALTSENAGRAYRIALAVQMLRKAGHKPDDEEDGFRRAYACLIADRLIEQVI